MIIPVKGKSSWTRQVGKRMAQHLANKTSDTHLIASGDDAIHHFDPEEIYQNPTRDKVARYAPFPILPSSLLQQGHSYADRLHLDGPSVLVHRSTESSNDGLQVQAYFNKCRHRGSQLVKDGTHVKGAAVSCPYHAWTYDARSGSLKGIPAQKECFPTVQKDDLSLLKLPCFEQAGFVWIGGGGGGDGENETKGNKNQQQPWSEAHSELSLILPEHGSKLLAYREWTLEANWQLIVETFLEAYHVAALHKDTLATVSHSVMVTDVMDNDRSYRMSVPLKNFDSSLYDNDKDGSRGDHEDDHQFFEQTTTTYFLYPHTAISVSKRFVFFVSIDPLMGQRGSDDPAEFSKATRIRTWAVKRTAGEDEDDDDLAIRDIERFTLGIEEDWVCAEDIARGIFVNVPVGSQLPSSSSTFTYGRYEGGNVLFLKNVADDAKQML